MRGRPEACRQLRRPIPRVCATWIASLLRPGSDLDAQGRGLIPFRLRDSSGMAGDVDVLGQVTYLDVWNHDRFVSKLQRDPYTESDARALAEYKI